MKVSYLIFIGISLFSLHNTAESTPMNWAILIASSRNFHNYRHQSDVYHAYHILLKNGFKEENIIVFAYDDIANHPDNPFPGKVFNNPNGEDVYKGVKIDYRQQDVSASNFLKVLIGDEEGMKGKGTGKVLKSTSKDNVFIYLSDHGLTKMIAFPGGYLYDNQLMEAFETMQTNKMYYKVVFYVETCHSGSMFLNLLSNMNIYVVVAAQPDESSYAIYCYPKDKIDGKSMGSCLGDEFSVRWMEYIEDNTEAHDKSLQEHYLYIKEKVKGSHVEQYGDKNLIKDKLMSYLYSGERKGWPLWEMILEDNEDEPIEVNKDKKPSLEDNIIDSRVRSQDVNLFYLKNKAMNTNDIVAYEEYKKELTLVERSNNIFEQFRKAFNLPNTFVIGDTDYDCLMNSIKTYEDYCGSDERDILHMNDFTNACTLKISKEKIIDTIKYICLSLLII